MLRAKIIDALYPPPPPDPESAEDKDNDPESAENKEPSASADENQKLLVDESKRLRVASMSMLEGIVFKLLVSTRQEASTETWSGNVLTTQIVDMVSATLGTDPATRQQVLTLPPAPGPHLKPYLVLPHRSSFASRLSCIHSTPAW